MDVARHDTDFAFVRLDYAGAVRADHSGFVLRTQSVLHANHVVLRIRRRLALRIRRRPVLRIRRRSILRMRRRLVLQRRLVPQIKRRLVLAIRRRNWRRLWVRLSICRRSTCKESIADKREIFGLLVYWHSRCCWDDIRSKG